MNDKSGAKSGGNIQGPKSPSKPVSSTCGVQAARGGATHNKRGTRSGSESGPRPGKSGNTV